MGLVTILIVWAIVILLTGLLWPIMMLKGGWCWLLGKWRDWFGGLSGRGQAIFVAVALMVGLIPLWVGIATHKRVG